MKVFDPLGLVCPFLLQGKILLRQTWAQKLSWDDALPPALHSSWLEFFKQTFELETLTLDRCLKPSTAVGKPIFVIFSNGSDLAYGFAAYNRWMTTDGQYWCRLVLAKSGITPMRKISTPQSEFNGAVLSKRGREVIEKEMRLPFERILHIVDNTTVLSMINKTSTRFHVYEGVRIDEIQTGTNSNMDD